MNFDKTEKKVLGLLDNGSAWKISNSIF